RSSAGRLEARVRGRGLARIGLEPDEPDARITLAEPADDLGARILTAVVDEDHLEVDAQSFEHRAELGPQRRETLLLVVHGDDDGEIEHQTARYPWLNAAHAATRGCPGTPVARRTGRGCRSRGFDVSRCSPQRRDDDREGIRC